MQQDLYFLAIIPPAPTLGRLEELKQQTALDYGTEHTLAAPAHLTLMAPFFFEEALLLQLQERLEFMTRDFRPFSVILHGFGFFEPHTFFVHVLQNRSLRNLEQRVWDTLPRFFPAVSWKDRIRFHPHIAIASKIEEENTFFRLQKSFGARPFHASFPVHDLVLLRWNDGWEPAMRIPLRG